MFGEKRYCRERERWRWKNIRVDGELERNAAIGWWMMMIMVIGREYMAPRWEGRYTAGIRMQQDLRCAGEERGPE